MSIPAGLVSPMKNHESLPINVIFLGKKQKFVQKSIRLTINGIPCRGGLVKAPLTH